MYDSPAAKSSPGRTGFAARVREARGLVPLTQDELAERMGVSSRAVQSWEGGARMPRPRLLRLLAEATGKPVAWFFSENGEEAA